MLPLYSVAIQGSKFYFCSNLAEHECAIIDNYCREISLQGGAVPAQQYTLLMEYIKSNYDPYAESINIERVFRIY